ncbi:MAG: sodium:alanine symporter family protein [Ruminococcaceae bacterium]|nr:sodium:alanine symporter family protein [Oscillospiraceae bacterium]
MLDIINGILWGKLLIVMLSLLGIKLLFQSRFFIFRKYKEILRLTIKEDRKALSNLCAALGGTIGVGNTVGVASAIAIGGAGSIFWMLVAAFLAMSVKFFETYLSCIYKDSDLGFGGPMYYIKALLNSRLLSNIFSFALPFCALFVGNICQSDMFCRASESFSGIRQEYFALILALFAGMAILKNKTIKLLGAVVPFMSVAYLLLCGVILFIQAYEIPSALMMIINDAFHPQAALGGLSGAGIANAISQGFSKGMFSNEAGMGSSPLAHSQSENPCPKTQGSWGVIEVFIDTVVICLITALVILSSPFSDMQSCFNYYLGLWGEGFFCLCMGLFAFASMCSWWMYADCALRYLNVGSIIRSIYKAVFILIIPIACYLPTETCLALGDALNAITATVNVSALTVISSDKKIKLLLKEL